MKVLNKLLFKIFCVFLGIMIVATLFSNSLLLFMLLAIPFIFLVSFKREKKVIALLTLGALFGSLGEITCIYFGAWKYAKPDFFGIPLWLPLAWGFGVILLDEISEDLLRLCKKKKQ